jgi:hypothetical protein
MKIRFLLLALVGVFLTSCQITENVYINDDGSGKLSFDIDASGVMAMAGDKMGSEKDIDSTFTFKQVFEEKKDSISKLPADEQARLKKMENISVNMKMNGAEKQFLISMFTNFKNANEMMDMMQAMNAMKPKQQNAMPSDSPLGTLGNPAATELKFSYDGTSFIRSVIIKDKAAVAAAKDTTGMTQMMFAGSNYTLKYHFPRKVKSVSNKTAMFSEDRKTVTVQYPFTEYLENPDKLNLEVVLEKK